MPLIVRAEPRDVASRLRALGLTIELLLEAVKAVAAGHAGCTENDPPAAPAWDGWRYGTRRLRELLRPEGWEKDDTDTYSVILNHGRRLRIVVVNTDKGTGLRLGSPMNRARKGPRSRESAEANQYVLDLAGFPQERERLLMRAEAQGYATWCLCVFVDDDVVRAELSQPVEYVGGFITGWIERVIFLGDGMWPDAVTVKRPDDEGDDGLSPDFPIEVRRK